MEKKNPSKKQRNLVMFSSPFVRHCSVQIMFLDSILNEKFRESPGFRLACRRCFRGGPAAHRKQMGSSFSMARYFINLFGLWPSPERFFSPPPGLASMVETRRTTIYLLTDKKGHTLATKRNTQKLWFSLAE